MNPMASAETDPGEGSLKVEPEDFAKSPLERLLNTGNQFYLKGHRIMRLLFPRGKNPFAMSGAIANTTLLIAVISGILLLIWYKPSVHKAYDSMEAISQLTFTAQLLRSIHRYSSDGCMFFVMIHAMQLFVAGRFRGSRWLAWVTGVLSVTLLWAVGWTGYWLVWDVRGQMVAVETAKILDLVPIFSDPMSRSFLTDQAVNSLFFFVIFFFHMLVPLAMGIALWLHIARLSRPNFLADKNTTIWITVSLIILSFILPAAHVDRANMLITPDTFTMDWWYMTPVWIVDRLSGGVFWGLFLIMGGVLYTLPFWRIGKKRAPALVTESRCNACRKCFNDCPYDAITMVARTDDMNYEARALVDPQKCVSCGICAGSCNSAGIGVPYMPVFQIRKHLESLMEADLEKDAEGQWYAFVCGETADLDVDPETALSPQLPGYRVSLLPCIGQVHMLTLERLVRKGAAGVLLAACGDETCKYREGVKWTRQRLEGVREPYFRKEKADRDKVRMVTLETGGLAKLKKEAQAFRAGKTPGGKMNIKPLVTAAVATLLITATIMIPVNIPYTPAAGSQPQLIVSFKHAGAQKVARQLTQEELEKLPVHMRNASVKERGRAPVRMKILVDGQELVNQSYKPGGLMGDSSSVALERMGLDEGEHLVQVSLGDTADDTVWNHVTEKRLNFKSWSRYVLLFDKQNGFTWHMPE